MAKDDITSDVSGLQLSNSTFSASPPGSLLRADECVMPQKGVIQPRLGQARYGTLATATTFPFAITQFDEKTIVSAATSKTSTSYGLGYNGALIFEAYTGGPYNPVDCTDAYAGRMKFAQANEYLHFCTTTGPKTLETGAGTPREAGLLRVPDPATFLGSASFLAGTDGAGLEYGFSRAYRIVIRDPTSNGTSLLSPPSGRAVVQNRILAPIGSMVRAANVVTVTLPGTEDPGLDPGDTFTVDPGEANFPAAVETVASVTDNVITYADVAANAVNTVAQDLDTGPRPVAIIGWLPADAAAGMRARVYRSRDVDGTDPSDEMFLVAEIALSGTNISNGFFLYVDVTPQSVTDDPLYTNPLTGEGAAQANFKPPLYRDITNWGASTWYANTTGFQQLRMQMLGVGPDDGVQDGDTLTINGEVFTFLDTPLVDGDVQIVSNGTPSFNIQQTTQNLLQVINATFDVDGVSIRTYGESTQSGAPGKLLIEATSYAQAVFTVAASRVATWFPALSATSAAQREPNQIAYSKIQQPESVPALNHLPVGSKSYPIGRIVGLQQALLVFKEGDGIWSVTGTAPFNVQQIATANLIARDTVCVFDDVAWALTDEGFLRISESGGATVVSRPIETALNDLLGALPEETYAYSFVVPYEQLRRVLLFVPFSFEVDDGPDRPVMKAWCYNNATQAWTGPLYADVFSGCVITNPDDDNRRQLVLGVYDEPWETTRLTIEDNAFVGTENFVTDYADEAFAIDLAAVAVDGDPLIVELADMTDVEAGDAIAQGLSVAGVARFSVIAALRPDISPTAVELYESRAWVATSAFLVKHYDAVVQFQPQGNPSARKTMTRLSWLFKPRSYVTPNAETIISTDQAQADVAIDSPSVGFGSNPFGSVPFGDPSPLVLDVNPLDPSVTNAAQFFVGLRFPVCASIFKLEGVAMRLEQADAPVGRGR